MDLASSLAFRQHIIVAQNIDRMIWAPIATWCPDAKVTLKPSGALDFIRALGFVSGLGSGVVFGLQVQLLMEIHVEVQKCGFDHLSGAYSA